MAVENLEWHLSGMERSLSAIALLFNGVRGSKTGANRVLLDNALNGQENGGLR